MTANDTNIETLTTAGGKRWTKNGMDRIYLDAADAMVLAGWQVSRYGTGNLADVRDTKGYRVSNNVARELGACKFFYDIASGDFKVTGASRKVASEVSEIVHAVAARIRGEA